MLLTAGWKSDGNGATFASPSSGWGTTAQIVAALALVVPVAVAMPSVEAPTLGLPSLFGDVATPTADATATTSSQTVAPGETPVGLTAAEWADIQAQIATASAPAAPATSTALDPLAAASTAVFDLAPTSTDALAEIPDVASMLRPVAIPGVDPTTASIGVGASTFAVGSGTATLGSTTINDRVLATAAIVADGRVERSAGPVTEWFRSAGGGVEQGWTITESIGDTISIEVPVSGVTPVAVDDVTARLDHPDGSFLWYRGLHAFDASGAVLPAHLHVADATISIHVDPTGATYPITVDPIIGQDEKVPGSVAGGRFGTALDLEGNTLVVGQPAHDRGAAGTGTVTVFTRSGPGQPWGSAVSITPPAGPEARGFGDAVAIRNGRIAIGMSERFSGSLRSGTVFIYEFVESWSFVDAISGTNEGDQFGASLAWLADDQLIVGAPGFGLAAPDTPDRGAVFVVAEGAPDWTRTKLDDDVSAPAPDAELGFSVAAGTTATGAFVVAGAPGEDRAGTEAGGMYVWESVAGSPAGVAPSVLASDATFGLGERAGTSVAFDADRIAIGSLRDQTSPTPITVRVFDIGDDTATPVTWTEYWSSGDVATDVTGIARNDFVDLRGGNLVFGHPGGGGQALVYRDDGVGFGSAPADELRPTDREVGDAAGSAVAFDGRTVVIGAPGDDIGTLIPDTDEGAVYVFEMVTLANRWIESGPGVNWSNTAGWDLGILPGIADTAVITAGSSSPSLDVSDTIGRLVMRQSVFAVPGTSATVAGNVDGTSVVDAGTTFGVADSASITFDSGVELDGTMTVDSGAIVAVSGSVVSGNGSITNNGRMLAIDATTSTIDSDVAYAGTGTLSASLGDWDVGSTAFTAEGILEILAGRTIDVAGNLTLEPGAQLFVTLDTSGGVMPTLAIDGSFFPNGEIVADFFEPDVVDDTPYQVVTCTASCGTIAQFGLESTGVLDVVRLPNAIALELISNKQRPPTENRFQFAESIDMDGDWAVVSDADVGGPGPGRAHVLRWDEPTSSWVIAQTLVLADAPGRTPGDGFTGARFGRDVAIDGNYLAIASPISGNLVSIYSRPDPASTFTFAYEVLADPDWAIDLRDDHLAVLGVTGELNIFRLTPAGAIPEFLTAVPNASFLSGLAIGGDIAGGSPVVAVGKPNLTTEADAVDVFAKAPAGWGLTATLTSGDSEALASPNYFGAALDMDETRLVVGEPVNDFRANDAGAAWVYDWDGTTLGAPQRLTAANGVVSDAFGHGISVDGNTLVIGAGAAVQPGFPTRGGAAYGFVFEGGSWVQVSEFRGRDTYGDDNYGRSLAHAGDRLLIGAFNDTNSSGPLSGAIYQVDAPLAPQPSVVATDGEWLAVGVPADRVVHIARYEAGTWVDTQTITDVGVTDIALSTPYLVIGDAAQDQVTVYGQSADLLFRQLVDGVIAGNPNSEFGARVELFDTRLAIGAPGDDVRGADAGRVELYDVLDPSVRLAVVDSGEVGDDLGAGDRFGDAFALTGTSLWVGAPGDDDVLDDVPDRGALRRYDADGNYQNQTLRGAPGTRFASRIDATAGRVAASAVGLTQVTVVDPVTGNSLIGSSDGFGSALAFSGDQLAVLDTDRGFIEIWSDDGQDGTYEYTGLDATPGDAVDDRHIDLDGGVLVRGIAAIGTTGWADALVVDDIVDSTSVKILPEPGSSGDQFGADVAIDGDTMVVTARRYDGPAGRDTGAAYVYERAEGEWFERQRIEGAAGAVALGGDALVLARGSSAAVLERSGFGSAFVETGILTLAQTPRSVAIDGATLVLGLPLDAAGEGQVLVYQGTPLEWTVTPPQTLSRDAANDVAGVTDLFGWDVDVSGNQIVVGAPLSASLAAPAAAESGYVEVWSRADAAAPFSRTRTLSGSNTEDSYAWSVAIEGDIVAVGLPTAFTQGQTYLYQLPTGTLAAVLGSPTTLFGSSVDIGDGVLVITSADLVTRYNVVGSSTNFTTLGISGLDPFDFDGGRGHVATSLGTVVIGAPGEDTQGADAGAAFLIEVEVPIDGLLVAPDATSDDLFGTSVVIHEDWMAVGARDADGATAGSGAVYLFQRIGDTDDWAYQTTLSDPTGAAGDWFGASVAMAGSTVDIDDDSGNLVLAVGAPRADGESGAVVLYRYDPLAVDDWLQTERISPNAGDQSFGVSVAIESRSMAFRNGGYDLIVGAPDLLRGVPGAAYSYRYIYTENPSPSSTLTLSSRVEGARSGDYYGRAVAIDGRRAVVSAQYEEVAGSDAGALHLYELGLAGEFTSEQIVPHPDAGAGGTSFGTSVSIDHDVVAVGAFFDGLNGSAYVSERIGSTWSTPQRLTSSLEGAGSQIGANVAVENGIVAVSSFAGGSSGTGFVTLFDRATGTWAERRSLEWPRAAGADGMGAGLSLSEAGELAIGFGEESFALPAAGAVFVEQVDMIEPANVILPPGDGDRRFFGTSLDTDGEWMIVAEPERGAFTDGPGRAHMFRRTGDAWTYFAELLDPDGFEANDRYAHRVALDGTWAAVSDNRDFVHTFRFDGIAWVAEASIPTPDPQDGFSIDLDGDNARLIIGRAETTTPGSASIYDLVEGGAHLANPVVTPGDVIGADRYGARVAIDGDRAFVGAPADVSTSGLAGAGSVRVLTRSGSTWSQVAVLTDGSGVTNGRFGEALDADGNRLIVGSIGGASATIFDLSSVTTTSQRLSAPVGASQFGVDVGIDGAVAVVGARYGVADTMSAGTAYVFQRTSSWQPVTTLSSSEREFADNFGESVDVSGTSVAVGVSHDDNDAGVFAGSVWTFSTQPPPAIKLAFDLAEASNQVPVAPTGIATSDFVPTAVEGTNASTIAASPLSSIELDGTPLSSITVANTPLSSIALDPNSVLGRLSLIAVDIDGGWQDILALSPTLAELPIQQVTLAQVFADTATAGRLASTPLSSINVNGTPLSSIPLSAIALGTLPLSSIPLSSIDGTPSDPVADWCPILVDLVPQGEQCDLAFLQSLTLIEATLAGTPLSSIPLSSIPLSSIDVAGTPLSSIPLSSIDFAATPLSSIPLSSIPLSSIPLSSIPLSSIPLSSIPLSSIPLSSIPLSSIGSTATLENTPLSSIDVDGTPLSSIPLSSIPLSSIPLSSIDVAGAPLSSIPLSSILLGPLPLSSIPLSSIDNDAAWCDLLADVGDGTDCTTSVDLQSTTLTEILVRGVPLSSIPLSSIPLSSIPLSSIPLSSIPLSSIPLSSIPLSSIPLSSIPLSSIDVAGSPLSSIPLSSIDVAGSPLSSIPLSSIPLSSIPLSSIPLSSIPLSSIPLSSIPLSSIGLDATPLSSIDVVGSPLSSIPLSSIPLSSITVDCVAIDCELDSLGDAVLAGAIDPATTLTQLQPALGGIRLADLVLLGSSAAALQAAVNSSGLFLSALAPFDDLTLGEITAALTLVPNVQIGALGDALDTVSFADLVAGLTLVDPASGDPIDVEALVRGQIDLLTDPAGQPLSVRDLDAVGDSTLGDLLDGGSQVTLADVWPVLSFISVEAIIETLGLPDPQLGGSLGDVEPYELGNLLLLALFGNNAAFDALTVGQLLAELDATGQLEGFTLADLLLALVAAGDLPFGGFDFTDVNVAELPDSTVAGVTFEAMFSVDATSPRTIGLTVELPASATYLPGTATLSSDFPAVTVPSEPVVGDNTLTWTVPAAAPGTTFTAAFDVRPTLQLGSTSLVARARVHGADVTATSLASIQVVEGLEVNDTPATAVQAATDTIYLTYISSATDVDVFQIPIADNDVLALELSNLSEDFDVALWYRPAPGVASTGTPLSAVGDQAPVFPITDPDQTSADAEPLEDFPRLDDIDPSLQLVDVSNSGGTDTETIVTDRLSAGDYFVQVYGRNGAVSRDPAALQIQVEAAEAKPECVNFGYDSGVAPGATFSPVGSTANTLILVNEQRLEQLYGAQGRIDVTTKLDELTTYLQVNPALGIDPAVVAVDGYPSVRDAYADWAADSCNPDAANDVVSAINAIAVDPLRDQLTHVVIVGGDDVIPMARLDDATTVANEYDYRHEFDGDLPGDVAGTVRANAFTSTAWDRRYLSDDPYGESAARSLGNRFLYVTDVALGRLVESPDEIVQSLDHFIVYDGSLDVQSATVLGYDFLVDGSNEISAELASAGLTVDDELADGVDADGNAWSRADAEQALIDAGTNELISLNAHFDHYRALPAEGDKVVGFDDNLIATEVELLAGDGAFDQSLLFSMGCHSGLAVPNGSIATTNQDWAEAVGRIGGVYVANTGFGYGDTEAVAYTERLMSRFADFVSTPSSGAGVPPTTVGQALMFAKNDYISNLGTLSVYDEKALMESTFYGLPFYQVGLAPEPLPAPPNNQTVPDADGNSTSPVSIDATNGIRTTDSGDYYANVDADGTEQTIVAPGRPIQPSTTADVSVVEGADPTELAEIAHGAIVVDMTSTYVTLTDPVVATPIFDASSQQPEPELGDVNFPARPLTISTITTPAGERQTLVAATGQYRSAERVQRLDDDLDIVVYYADRTVTDFKRPVISEVNAVLQGGLLTVTLRASDAAGVDRVYLLVAADPQLNQTVDWIGVDLRQTGDIWSGSTDLGIGVERVEFIAQAKDVNGNVGVSTNKATNFGEDAQPEPVVPPTPTLEVVVDNSNFDEASGWYTSDVSVTVRSDTPATVRLDGAAAVPIADSFTISGDGVHTFAVTNESGQTASGIVRIDTSGDPVITIGAPMPQGSYVAGSTLVDARCTDPSLTSCDIAIDGVPAAVGDPLPAAPGVHSISVTATDAFGNVADIVGTFTIIGPPNIVSVAGPIEPQPIGAVTTVDVVFTDSEQGDGSYTIAFDWGDGTTSSCATDTGGDCTINSPTANDAGTAQASHTYAAPGIYSVLVEVADEAGLDDARRFEFVVIYDAAAGQVNGAGKYLSGSDALVGRPLGEQTAKFAFNAQYEDDDTAPSGKTMLKLGKNLFDFKSTSYDYLLLSDTVATAGGTGKVDGIAGYRFMVQAVDQGSTDYVRIVIWNDATGDLVYDNGALFAIGDEVTSGGGVKIKQ